MVTCATRRLFTYFPLEGSRSSDRLFFVRRSHTLICLFVSWLYLLVSPYSRRRYGRDSPRSCRPHALTSSRICDSVALRLSKCSSRILPMLGDSMTARRQHTSGETVSFKDRRVDCPMGLLRAAPIADRSKTGSRSRGTGFCPDHPC